MGYPITHQTQNKQMNNSASITIPMIATIHKKVASHPILNKGKDSIVIDKGAIYTFSISENQKNNTKINITTTNLGEWEDKLRKYYSISIDTPLLIFKIDVFEEGIKNLKFKKS